MPLKTRETIQNVLQKAAELLDLGPDVEVSVLLVDNDTIRTLNWDYRNKDTETDVLSFPLEEEENSSNEPKVIGGPTERVLGDIVISVEQAVIQAEEYGHSVEREIAFLSVHGLLHLIGYDHEKGPNEAEEMRNKEKWILQELRIGK